MDDSKPNSYKDTLSEKEVFVFSIGHLCNDIGSALWFTYSPWYLNEVLKLTSQQTGTIFFYGQLADALSNPFVGYFSDKIQTRIGKRMPWYIIGHLLTVPSLYFIFNPFEEYIQTEMYFLVLTMFFNTGWAAIQLAHLSMINSITQDLERRAMIINYRDGCTYAGNIFALVLTLILFENISNDRLQFGIMVKIASVIGITSTIIFILGIKEIRLTKEAEEIA